MRRSIWIAIILVVMFLVFFGSTIVRLYTDWLWFSNLGAAYEGIFSKVILTKLALFGIFGVLFFAIMFANLTIARRLAPPTGRIRVGWDDEIRQRVEAFIRKGLGPVILIGSLVVAFFVALQAAGSWNQWLQFANATPFGIKDPMHGIDIGFYVFKLPFWEFLYNWLFGTILVALIATAVLHYFAEGIDFFGSSPSFAPGVKAQLAILLSLLFFLKAAGYRLAMYNLVLTDNNRFFGAGYTDVHARMPMLWLLLVAAVVGGLLVLINIYRRGIWLATTAFVGLIAISIVCGAGYPAIVDSVRVQPNEQEAQRPYIARAIQSTRAAFAVDQIASRDFAYVPDLSPDEIAENPAAIQNIRLWDYDPLKSVYNQTQAFLQYFQFNDVDIDRYTINGTYRQVMLSAREISAPPSNADTWVNRALRYTHGYAYSMSPVNEKTGEGLPTYFASGIPLATVSPTLDLKVPQIYFGEMTSEYALVNTTLTEVDYTRGSSEVDSTYSAKGGPEIGTFFRRLLFAFRFGDANILLSSALKPDSRILFRRNINERVEAMFPFLSFDSDPYLVTVDGKMYWFRDAYTTTDHYPYSQQLESTGQNYMRNSVKIVIDAYTGDVSAYIYDPTDPIIRTWANAFPGVLKAASEMPESFRAHVRYPEELFVAQAEIYGRYHVTDPVAFYNAIDVWGIPTSDKDASSDGTKPMMEPYYIITRLPNSSLDEFILILPMIRPGKNNMVAWMAAKCDPVDYGRMITYKFPSGRTVFGPSQVMARANQDTTISQQLTLWNQQGSGVVRGNMLAIPINNSVLYVEPLYLQATGNQIPEVKQVILSLGDRLVMKATLQEALSSLMGTSVAISGETAGITPPTPAKPGKPGKPSAAPSAPAAAQPADVQGLIKQANDQFTRAQEAQRRGDWAGYGREIDALKKTLQQLGAGKR